MLVALSVIRYVIKQIFSIDIHPYSVALTNKACLKESSGCPCIILSALTMYVDRRDRAKELE